MKTCVNTTMAMNWGRDYKAEGWSREQVSAEILKSYGKNTLALVLKGFDEQGE